MYTYIDINIYTGPFCAKETYTSVTEPSIFTYICIYICTYIHIYIYIQGPLAQKRHTHP